jgi:hypothetical protein
LPDLTGAVASPKLLETGVELVKLGIPIGAVLGEYERLQQTTADIAAHFTELFERHLWRPFAKAGMPPGQVQQLTATLQRLGPVAESVVTLTLRHALRQQAASFIAKQAAKTIHPQNGPR